MSDNDTSNSEQTSGQLVWYNERKGFVDPREVRSGASFDR